MTVSSTRHVYECGLVYRELAARGHGINVAERCHISQISEMACQSILKGQQGFIWSLKRVLDEYEIRRLSNTLLINAREVALRERGHFIMMFQDIKGVSYAA